MSARSMVLLSALSLTLAPAFGLAQDAAAPKTDASVKQEQVDNSKVAFSGVVNSGAVYIRSGPSENYYPTLKLEKGEKITVVGIKFDWLKIVPPEGSFCYVAKTYINKTGASTGEVSRPSINVRAGSSLNPQKGTIQTQLQEGDKVSIIGEQDEYYKIKPPAGAFLFVNKQFIDPVRQLAQGEVPVTPPPHAPAPRTPEPIRISPPSEGNTVDVTPPPTTPDVAPAATQTAEQAQAEADYDKTEADFDAASSQPLDAQPLGDLVTRYTALVSNERLPVTLRRNAEVHLRAAKARLNAQNDLLAARKIQEESNQRLAKLKEEQDAISQRLAGTGARLYTAIGNLESSTLDQNGAPLYRLTDPGTGHTVVYVKADNALPAKMGTFVGVKGDVLSDQTLGVKVITPKSVETVDASAVGKTVSAEMMPQSMLPKAVAAPQ